MKRILIVLAAVSGTATAQPGATPPVQPGATQPAQPGVTPPVQQPQAAPQVEVQAQAHASAALDLDTLVAKARAASPTLVTIARGTFRRARRAISFGPTVGVWSGSVFKQSEIESAITFGLGIETFKVPVLPDLENLQEIAIERAKAKLKEVLASTVKGEQLDPMAVDQLVREVYEEAVQEVLGLANVRPKTMERPMFTFALEVDRKFNYDAWEPRLRAGVGIWKFTFAASSSIALGTDGFRKTPVYTGLELVAHFLVSDNPRASVADVFLRADFELRNRSDQNTDQLVLGVRYLLDLI